MRNVRLDKHDVAGRDGMNRAVVFGLALPAQHIYFMLVVVLVMRRVAAGLDSELPHRERGRTVTSTDEQPHANIADTVDIDRVRGEVLSAAFEQGSASRFGRRGGHRGYPCDIVRLEIDEFSPRKYMSTTQTRTPNIETFVLGDYQTNCFVVTPGPPAAGTPCWLVDCGFDSRAMLDFVRRHELDARALLLTHCHPDHIAGVDEALTVLGRLPIYAHRAEAEWNSDPMLNMSSMIGIPISVTAPDHLLDGGETLDLAGTSWRVVHTPGHSPGGVCFIHDASKQAIVGDTLFAGSIGRIDFPNSDPDAMRRTIQDVIMQWPDDMAVLPGHGPATTVGDERRRNPFVVQGF